MQAGDGKRIWTEERISEKLACVDCGISFGKMEPRNFSFNSPYGACPHCNGLGTMLVMDPALAVNESLSIRKGAIPGWRRGPRHLIMFYNHLLKCIAAHVNMPDMTTVPFGKLPEHVRKLLLYGSGDEPIDFSYYMRGKRYNMVKPFEPRELLARIRTAIRHARGAGNGQGGTQAVTFLEGRLVIDHDKHRVFVDGEDAGLTQNEFKLVSLLGKYAGKVLTYDYMMKEIWGPNMKNDNRILRVNMANIRRKIEKNPAQPQYIFTEVGVGYRIVEPD